MTLQNYPATKELQEKDNHFLHPWELMSLVGHNERTIIERAEGIYVYDTEGNRLLDAPAGMWCQQIGHGREEMADAIHEQVMRMTYASPWGLSTAPAGPCTGWTDVGTAAGLDRV